METLAVRILRTIFSRGRVLNEGETLETDAAEAQELLKNGWAQPADGETADTKPEKGKKNGKPKNNAKGTQPENPDGGTNPDSGGENGEPDGGGTAQTGENGEPGGSGQPENGGYGG